MYLVLFDYICVIRVINWKYTTLLTMSWTLDQIIYSYLNSFSRHSVQHRIAALKVIVDIFVELTAKIFESNICRFNIIQKSLTSRYCYPARWTKRHLSEIKSTRKCNFLQVYLYSEIEMPIVSHIVAGCDWCDVFVTILCKQTIYIYIYIYISTCDDIQQNRVNFEQKIFAELLLKFKKKNYTKYLKIEQKYFFFRVYKTVYLSPPFMCLRYVYNYYNTLWR